MPRVFPMGGGVLRKAGFVRDMQDTSRFVGDDADVQAALFFAPDWQLLDSGQYADSTNIVVNGKTDAHLNSVVIDNARIYKNGGHPMWLNHVSASVGPASDGKLPYTTTGSGETAEGIVPYRDAANAAAVAGHSDWRIPTADELHSICTAKDGRGMPDPTYFPSFPNASIQSSTTQPNNAANNLVMAPLTYTISNQAKTSTALVLLVRNTNP